MKLEHPAYFLMLLVFFPLTLVALRNYFQSKRTLFVLTGKSDKDRFFAAYMVKCFFVHGTFFLFLFFSVLSLVEFSWGKTPVEEDRNGLDVVFAIDVSRSMLAQDVKPNRLAAAGDVAREIALGLPSARFAVVVFKGSAVTAVPMTEDRGTIEAVLDNLSPGLARLPGTDIEEGLRQALASFPAGSGRHRVILLLSDGGSLSGSSGAAALKAAEEGVPVLSVGFGGRDGVTVKNQDGTFVLGENGKPVVTALYEETIRAAAELSGGKYFSAGDSASSGLILEEIQSFEGTRSKMGFRLVSISHYRIFLVLGFFCLAAHVFLRSYRWKNLL